MAPRRLARGDLDVEPDGSVDGRCVRGHAQEAQEARLGGGGGAGAGRAWAAVFRVDGSRWGRHPSTPRPRFGRVAPLVGARFRRTGKHVEPARNHGGRVRRRLHDGDPRAGIGYASGAVRRQSPGHSGEESQGQIARSGAVPPHGRSVMRPLRPHGPPAVSRSVPESSGSGRTAPSPPSPAARPRPGPPSRSCGPASPPGPCTRRRSDAPPRGSAGRRRRARESRGREGR